MMTHSDRKIRRQKMAEYAKDHSDRETARKFGCHQQTVRFSRVENNITKKHKQEVPASSYKIIAALIADEKHADIARAAGVSRQFVGQVRDRALKHGVFAAVKNYAKKNRDGN